MLNSSWAMTGAGDLRPGSRLDPMFYWAIAIGVMAGALAAFGGWKYAALLLVLALLARWPVQIALGALAFALPFDNVAAMGSESTGATLTRYLAALAVFVLLTVGLAGNRLALPPRAAVWWSLFVLWGVVTLGWAEDFGMAWARLPTALSLLLLYLLATSFQIRRKELAAVMVMAVLGGCAAAWLASTQFFSGNLFHQTARASLMIGERETDPNQFAASLLLPLSVGIAALVTRKGWFSRTVAGGVVALLGLGVLLTMSRGGLIAAATVVLIYLYRMRFSRKLVIAVACLGLLLFFMPEAFFQRLSLADRGAGRMDIWAASLSLIPHYGFFGAGWNNFIVAYSGVAGSAPKFHGYTEGSHNIYLGMLIELGIVGLGLLLLAVRSQLRDLRARALVPYEAACWGMLVMGFTLDVVWRKSFWMCWILSAMAISAQRQLDPEPAP